MKKLLLMGYEGVGKSSMQAVIFANFRGKDTASIGYTVQRKEHQIKFMGSLILNLWDCGGQDKFMEEYFSTQKETIFLNASVMIYVFGANDEGTRNEKSLHYWQECLLAMQKSTATPSIFVLIHKIDKLTEGERDPRLKAKQLQIEQIAARCGLSVKRYFYTSIFNQTLYQAWSSIVRLLIPNHSFIQKMLQSIADACACSEIVLFERTSFLVLSSFTRVQQDDLLKYEKVANIIKRFKISSSKAGSNIDYCEFSGSGCQVLVHQFTKSVNILAVFSEPQGSKQQVHMSKQIVIMNINNAGKMFEDEMKKISQKTC